MRPTFHLVPLDVWAAVDPAGSYSAPSLVMEGFIHCTDGVEALIATANRYYRTDPRPYVALTIDLDRAGAPWRIDVPGSPYPHIYGPIALASVIAVQHVRRDPSGAFIDLARRSDEPSSGRSA